MRVFLYLSYNGSKFSGFQEQINKKSVMDKFISSCKKLGIESKAVGSGRTDTNVHALNQVIHLDLPTFWQENISKLQNSLNNLLSPNIYIKKIVKVKNNFHARFDAKKRLYRYILYHDKKSPFLNEFALFSKSLNIEKINCALSCFVGEHDFEYFKKTGSLTNNDIRTIFKAYAYKYKNFTIINILGNGFLRSQVRMIVSSVLEVENSILKIDELQEQIAKKNKHTTKLVSGCGLYLSRIFYDFTETTNL